MSGGTGCVRCVVEAQAEGAHIEAMPLPPVVVVFGGKSLCLPHFNTERGWPANYGLAEMMANKT